MTDKKRYRPMHKTKMKLRYLLLGALLGLLILWLIAYARSGSPYSLMETISVKEKSDGSYELKQQKVPYTVKVNFGHALLDEAQREKKLIIYSQKATVPYQIEKEGLFGWSVYSQTKSMIFHGVGTYSVDLAQIGDKDIIFDSASQTLQIHIPEPVLSVEYLPEETEFFNTSNGILRFGEMQLTPEMMTELETLAKEKLRKSIEEDQDYLETARKFAALSVKEIFEPVLRKQINAALEEANDQFAIPPYYTIQVLVGDEKEEGAEGTEGTMKIEETKGSEESEESIGSEETGETADSSEEPTEDSESGKSGSRQTTE